MWASDMAKSMIKMQQYKRLMQYSMMLPVMVMVPLFLTIQGLTIYCIGKVRSLVPICGPQSALVPARGPLELYYFHDSPCCQKVRLALEEVGLGGSCHRVHLDVGRYGKYDHLKDAHLKRNPTGTVPVLVHNGRPVLDATTILRYVEERLDGNASLVPPTEDGRADMDALVDECDVDLRPKALSAVEHSWGNAVAPPAPSPDDFGNVPRFTDREHASREISWFGCIWTMRQDESVESRFQARFERARGCPSLIRGGEVPKWRFPHRSRSSPSRACPIRTSTTGSARTFMRSSSTPIR